MTSTSTRHTQTPMFSGPLRWASNFETTPFFLPALGCVVGSGEHGFNALKTLDPAQRQWILDAPDPRTAKQRGVSRTKVTLRPGWDHGGRVRAMQSVLMAKFALPAMAERLATTGTVHLVETNSWHDNFWGDCFCARCADKPGVNMLGELLMALRAKGSL